MLVAQRWDPPQKLAGASEPQLVSLAAGAADPKPALGVLISTCHRANFISHCPHDRASCKGYLTPCGEPSVLANRLLTSRASLVPRGTEWGEAKDEQRPRVGWGFAERGAQRGQALCFWRILGADPPLTPSVQWSQWSGDSCTLGWNGRFPGRGRRRRRREGGGKKRVWGPSEGERDTQQWHANPHGGWLGGFGGWGGMERLEKRRWWDKNSWQVFWCLCL